MMEYINLLDLMEKGYPRKGIRMNSIYTSKFMWSKIKILKKIFNVFGNDNIFFVGGVVRNLLLNQELEDIDLAVKFNSDKVKQKLKK